MTRLALSFLGGFQVVLDGRPVTEFKSNKARALLAYLAVEAGSPHRREALAGLLWPDRTDRDALSNLRYTLASLRRSLDDRSLSPPILLITHHTIQFNQASDTWLDVAELERQIGDAGAGVADLQSALSLYRGGFLEGFSVGDAAPFEEWALLRREQIAQQVISAFGDLVAALEGRGEHREAQAYAQRQVALEPWNEAAHRALMRSLALHGQRNAALHQFQTCYRTLRDELGVEPAEETTALYDAIRAGTLAEWEPSPPAYLFADLLVSKVPPVVARESQLAQLESLLAQMLTGTGRVVFITGEAGSGKTVLLREFARRAMQARAELLVAGGTCDAVTGSGDPYLPFREILQLLTGDIEPKRAGTALAPEHVRRLCAAIPDAAQALVDQGPDLIDTFVPGAGLALRFEAFASQSRRDAWRVRLEQLLRPAAGTDKGSRLPLQQTDIFDQVTHVLQALARRHPLVLVLDDLQWADAGSVGLLFHFGRRIATSRILMVAAYRPDAIKAHPDTERHPLELVVNELQRLSGREPIDLDASEGRPFVEALLDTEPNRLGVDFRELLLRHTEGHPLFTVELLRSLEERGDLVRDAEGRWTEGPALHWEKLPARVEAAIAERIGRLPDRCRTLLAAASVEGEEFTAEVVAQALGADERAVVQCLSGELSERHRLVTAVSLRWLGTCRLSRYRFRHRLFQRYLYDHMDAVQRGRLHEAIGVALEVLHDDAPDELEALAPRLAWHFEVSGLADRAAMYHLRAGRRAAQLAAHEDAIGHLARGQTLLEALPDSPERTRLKLNLQLAVISPLSFARGFWAPERIDALKRAYDLSQQPALRDSPERGAALAAVAYFALWSAEPARTREAGEELLRLAERSEDAHQLLLAHCLVGAARWLCAELASARKHLDKALAHYARGSDHTLDMLFGFHAGVMSLAWQSNVLWLLGYPDQAARCLQDALEAAQAGNSPVTLAYARSVASMTLFLIGRDAAAAWQQIEALRQLRNVGPVFESLAEIFAGHGAIEERRHIESLKQMRQGMATFQVVGGAFGHAAQLLLLAQSYARAGQAETGLDTLDEALAWMDRSGVHLGEPEAHRLQGEFLLIGQAFGEDTARSAEACFREAIAIARRQEARWWELRATVSLFRLLKGQNTKSHEAGAAARDLAEARQMLTDIYSWFSEGFDTQDLREARELLEALDLDSLLPARNAPRLSCAPS